MSIKAFVDLSFLCGVAGMESVIALEPLSFRPAGQQSHYARKSAPRFCILIVSRRIFQSAVCLRCSPIQPLPSHRSRLKKSIRHGLVPLGFQAEIQFCEYVMIQ